MNTSILFFLQLALSASEIAMFAVGKSNPAWSQLNDQVARLLIFQERIKNGEEITEEELDMPSWEQILENVRGMRERGEIAS